MHRPSRTITMSHPELCTTQPSATLESAALRACSAGSMRSLEVAGLGGLGVIAVFAVIIVWKSVAAGLPAIADGELPLLHLQVWLPRRCLGCCAGCYPRLLTATVGASFDSMRLE